MSRKPTLPPARSGTRPPGRARLPQAPAGPTKLERIKAESHQLRGTLPGDLAGGTDHFDEAGKQLLKFHGIYQQDDRDQRSEGRQYQFMIRSRIPGGRLTAEQYLVHDDLAERFGGATLRLTTRQAIQFHGILKGDLRPTLQGLNEVLVTTLAACGDVARNVMCSPAPLQTPVRLALETLALQLSDRLLPRAEAYHEIWIDGERARDGKPSEPDPLYGPTYLPRKFKIGLAPPGDNSVDVFTQDVGLVGIEEDGQLAGVNVLVGGGLGMTHKKPETFPRLADVFAFATPEQVVEVVEAVVLVQRDHGDRTNRKHARLKYLIHDWGLGRFRRAVEDRLGYRLTPPRPMPRLEPQLFHGWHAQGDGRWWLGLSIENGRVRDGAARRLRSGLRAVVERFRPCVRLTPSQDLLLTDLRGEDRAAVDALLAEHGIAPAESASVLRRHSMACPALPTCGLAIAESERVMPELISALEAVLDDLGLSSEVITVRMTGCPNGCARPYVADIGLVGRSLDRYTLFLGGRADGTRLNEATLDLVPREEIVPRLHPLLALFAAERAPGESFGDFCHRLGATAVRAVLTHTPAAA